jgi:hypothetical protein
MSTVQPGGALPGSDLGAQVGATVFRMMLGSQLRSCREAAGITPDEAGYEIRASRSKISRLEHGRVGFKERDVADLLTLYGITDQQVREQMLALARQGNAPDWWTQYADVLPGWFEAYMSLETAASLIRTFDLQWVHGLFQTEAYARAVIRIGHRSAAAAQTERRVNLRMERQGLLTRPDPPRVWSVVDEAALRRPVGGRTVLRAQLERLIELAGLPHVTLQVMPFRRGGHTAPGGSFTVLRFARPELPDVVYIEHLTSALYLDRRAELDQYMEAMNSLSAEALTPAGTIRFIREIVREI